MSNPHSKASSYFLKSLQDTSLIHGEHSPQYAQAQSILGWQYVLEENWDEAIPTLFAASNLCKEICLNDEEIGLDVDYKYFKAIEKRATDGAMVEKSKEFLSRLLERRRKFDQKHDQSLNEFREGKLLPVLTIIKPTGMTSSQLSSIVDESNEIDKTENEQSKISKEEIPEEINIAKQNLKLSSIPSNNNFSSSSNNLPTDIIGKISECEEQDSTLIYYDEAVSLWTKGEIETSIELIEYCLLLRKRKFGPMSPCSTTLYLEYAHLLREKGNYLEAKKKLEAGLNFLIKAYGKNNLKVSELLNSIGNILRLIGNYDEAFNVLEETLTIRIELLGEYDIQVGATLNNIAELLREKQNYEESLKYHERAVSIFKKQVGLNHPGTMNVIGNLGITQQRYSNKFKKNGENNIDMSLIFMHENNFEANHPWIVKFSGEKLFYSIENNLHNNMNHSVSLKYLENLIIHRETELSRRDPSDDSIKNYIIKVQESSFSSPTGVDEFSLENLRYLRFLTRLNYCQELLDDNKFREAFTLFNDVIEPYQEEHVSHTIHNKLELEFHQKLKFIRLQIQFLQSNNSSKQLMYLNNINDLIVSIKNNLSNYSTLLLPFYLFIIEAYLSIGRYQEAKAILTQFSSFITYYMKYDQKCFGSITSKIAQGYLLLHSFYLQLNIEIGDYQAAKASIDLCNNFLSLHSELKSTLAYSSYLIQIGNYYSICGTITKILSSYKDALSIIALNKGKEHLLYAKTLLLISQWECISGNYNSAEQNFQEASLIIRDILSSNNLSILNLKGHGILAFQYYVSGLFSKALDRREEARKSFELALEKSKNWYFDDHPLTILIHTELGEMLTLLRDFQNAENNFSKAFFIYTNFFEGGQPVMGKVIEAPPSHQSCLYYKSKIQLGQTKLKFHKGEYIPALEFNKLAIESVNKALSSHSNITTMTSLFKLEIMILEAKLFPIFNGSVKKLRDLIGTIGTYTNKFFSNSNNIFTLTSVILKANLFILERRNKDAKIILSFAYIISMILFSTRTPQHNLFLQVLDSSFHNMRHLGYFRDANDVLVMIETLVDKFYSKDSIEQYQYVMLNYVHYFIDTRKYSRVEEYIKTTCQPLCTSIYSDKFYHSLQLSTLLAKALLLQSLPIKQNTSKKKKAEEELSQSYETSLKLYEENIKKLFLYSASSNSIPQFLLEAKDDLMFYPLVIKPKPAEQTKRVLIDYEETILVDYKRYYSSENITTSNYAASVNASKTFSHPYILHAQSRVAQMMNMVRKDSGRKLIYDVLDKYDTYPIYPFPHDHPYVYELGGYEKSSSKDRLSRNIEEDGFSAWASYFYEDYINYKDKDAITLVPRNIFIDIQNNDILLWCEVHFYGEENEEIRKKIRSAPLVSENRALTQQEQLSNDQQKSVAVTSEALETEIKKRKEAEDIIVTLNFEKQNLEEALDDEKELTSNLTQRLNDEIEEKLLTQKKLDEAENEIADLIKRLRETENSLNDYIRREEEEIKRKKEEEEVRKAEEQARLAAELELAEKMKGVRVFNHEEKKALDSATYSLSRAQSLMERGWFSKALTLLTETVLIREKLLGLYHNEYFLALFQYAKCLSEMKLYEESLKVFKDLLRLYIKSCIKEPGAILKIDTMEEILGKKEIMENEFPLQVRVEIVYNQVCQHLYPESEQEIDRLSRILADKTSNSSTKTKISFLTFAKILNVQATLAIVYAKYSEAKAYLDRAHSFFQKSIGYHGYGTIETLLIRGSLAHSIGKSKEVSAIVDQIQIVLESHFKGVDTSVPPDTIPPSETITNDSSEIINVHLKLSNVKGFKDVPDETAVVVSSPDKKKPLCHPYLINCNLLLADSAFQQSKYFDAKIKIDKAREMLEIFTPSFLLDERHILLDILNARYLTYASKYVEAKTAYLSLHESVLSFTKTNFPENTIKYSPILSTLYFDISYFLYKVGFYSLSRGYIEKSQTFASRLKSFDVRFIESQILNVRISFALEEFAALQTLIDNIRGQLEVILPSEVYSYHYLYQTLSLLDTSYIIFCKHSYSDAEQNLESIIKQLRVSFSHGHALLAEALGNKFLSSLYRSKKSKPEDVSWDTLRSNLDDFNIGSQSIYGFSIHHEGLARCNLFKGLLDIYEIEFHEALQETADGEAIAKTTDSNEITNTQPRILDLTKYFDLLDNLSEGVEKLSKSFGFDYSEKQDIYSSNSILQLPNPTIISSKSIFNSSKKEEITLDPIKSLNFFSTPQVLYTEAKIGQVKLMAHVAQQNFLKSLSDAEKVQYFANLNDTKSGNVDTRYSYYNIGMKSNSKNKNSEPQGKKVLQNSIDIFLNTKSKPGWYVTLSHSYPSELNNCLNSLKLKYDPLQIALSKFEKAKEKIKNNEFIVADFLLDESFILITQSIGIKLCSNSDIISQILFLKGSNSRNLSRNHNFIRSIFSLGLKIYRTFLQDAHAQDLFCSQIENELALISMDQFLYDEAIFSFKVLISRIQPLMEKYPTHINAQNEESHTSELNRLIQMINNPTPDFVIKRNEIYLHVINAQVNISLCYANLYSYDLALKYNSEARKNFNDLINAINLNKDVALITKSSDSWKLIFEAEVRIHLNEVKVLVAIGQFYRALKLFLHIEELFKKWTVDCAYSKLQEIKTSDILNQLEVENYSSQLETLRFISPYDQVIKLLNSEDFKLQSLVCDYLTLKADYFKNVNRLKDASDLIELVIQKRIISFNRFAQAKEDNKPINNKDQSHLAKNQTNNDPILQVEIIDCLGVRGAEVRRDFMIQLDQLLNYTNTNLFKNKDNVEKSIKKNDDPDPLEAEMDKSIQVFVDGWNSEIMNTNKLAEDSINQGNEMKQIDFEDLKKINMDSQSFTASLELDPPSIQDFKLTFSNVEAKNYNKNEKIDILAEFAQAPSLNEVYFNYNNNKLTPHSIFIPIFLLQARISFLKGNVPLAKSSLDLALFMGNLLLPKVSYVKLDIDHLYGELKIFTNQLDESKKLLLKALEDRLSLSSSHSITLFEDNDNLSVSRVCGESYFKLSQLYTTLCNWEDASLYIADALKVERSVLSPANILKILNSIPPISESLTPYHDFEKEEMITFEVDKDIAPPPSHTLSPLELEMLLVSSDINLQKGSFVESLTLLLQILPNLKILYSHDLISGGYHLSIVENLYQTAFNYFYISKFDLALSILHQATNLITMISGDNSHYYFGLINHIQAKIYRDLGKFLEAKSHLDNAIICLRNQFGKYHYLTVKVLLDLGQSFFDLGRFDTSKLVLERAIHLIRKSLGKDHLLVAQGGLYLSDLLINIGKFGEAQTHLDNSLFIVRKVMGGEQFPIVISIYICITELKIALNSYDVAFKHLEQAMYVAKYCFSAVPQHIVFAKIVFFNAKILYLQCKLFDARLNFEKTLSLVKKALSDSSSQVSSSHSPLISLESQLYLTHCMFDIGQVEQAKASIIRCLTLYKDTLGSSHPKIASILTFFGQILNSQHQYALAESVLMESWVITARDLKDVNPNHTDISWNLIVLADNLRMRGLLVPEDHNPELRDNALESETLASFNSESKTSSASKSTKNSATRKSKGFTDLVRSTVKSANTYTLAAKLIQEGNNDIPPQGLDVHSSEIGQDPQVVDAKHQIENKQGYDSSLIDELLNDKSQIVVDDLSSCAENSQYSVPTVAISAIEHLETSHSLNQFEGTSPSSTMALGINDEAKMFMQDPSRYRALPLIESAVKQLLVYFEEDSAQPRILYGKYILAETLRMQGQLEESLALHELVYQQRRKVLGDLHIDCIFSLVSITEVLKLMKKVFPKSSSVVFNTTMKSNFISASGDSLNKSESKQTTSGIGLAEPVKLADQLTSILLPVLAPMKRDKNGTIILERPNEFDNIGFVEKDLYKDTKKIIKSDEQDQFDPNDLPMTGFSEFETIEEKLTKKMKNKLMNSEEWTFLTKPKNSKSTTKSALQLKGYMGYAFPQHKEEIGDVSAHLLSSLDSENDRKKNKKNTSNHSSILHDPKKCVELALNLIKKILSPFVIKEMEDKERQNMAATAALTRTKNLNNTSSRSTNSLSSSTPGMASSSSNLSSNDHPLIAHCLYLKGEISRIRNEDKNAISFYESSLSMRRRIFRSKHGSVADCLIGFAELLRGNHRCAQALPLFDKALEIRLNIFGRNHPLISELKNSLAMLYLTEGDLLFAEKLLHESLAIAISSMDVTKHPSIALLYQNLAILSHAKSEYTTSLNWYKKSISMKLKIYGEEHPEIAISYNNLGLVYRAIGMQEEAVSNFIKAEKIQRYTLGSKHPDLASTLNNLASIYSTMEGKKLESKEIFKQSLNIRLANFGENHPLVAMTMNNYAILLHGLGDMKQSRQLLESSLEIRKKILSEMSPSIAESLHNLAYWHYTMAASLSLAYLTSKRGGGAVNEEEDYLSNSLQHSREARVLYEEALRIRIKSYGNPNAIIPNELAVATGAKSKIEQSITDAGSTTNESNTFNNSILTEEEEKNRHKKEAMNTLGNHILISNTALHLSGVCEQLGDLQMAAYYAKQSYLIRENLYGDLNPMTIASKQATKFLEEKLKAKEEKEAKRLKKLQEAEREIKKSIALSDQYIEQKNNNFSETEPNPDMFSSTFDESHTMHFPSSMPTSPHNELNDGEITNDNYPYDQFEQYQNNFTSSMPNNLSFDLPSGSLVLGEIAMDMNN